MWLVKGALVGKVGCGGVDEAMAMVVPPCEPVNSVRVIKGVCDPIMPAAACIALLTPGALASVVTLGGGALGIWLVAPCVVGTRFGAGGEGL